VLAFLLRFVGYGAVAVAMHNKEPRLCLFYALIFGAEFLEAFVIVIAWWFLQTKQNDDASRS